MLINTVTPSTLPRIPKEYQEVEWIASTDWWWQYINTWMANVTANTKVEYSFTPMKYNQSWLFMDTAWNSNGFGSGRDYYYYWAYNSAGLYPSCSVWTKVTITIARDWCYKDWANKRVPTTTSTNPPWTVILFCDKRWWNNNNYSYIKYHYYKRRESWELVQDFIPCYRKSDNVIWMYDLVGKQFYTNSWTWTFSKGADVN